MNKQTDWLDMWANLVQISEERRKQKYTSETWYGRAEDFRARVKKRWKVGMDSSRRFVLDSLNQFPQASVLDIGAGTGDWALLMAEKAKAVTALDPSESMLSVMRERVNQSESHNITLVQGEWPDVSLGKFDLCFCSHAIYGARDIIPFIDALNKTARKRVILLVRAPQPDAVMAQAAQLVFGHPYDSPNYQILINILFSLGIFPNVLMEDRGLWKPWICDTVEDALIDIKQRLGLVNEDRFDQNLKQLLARKLKKMEYGYEWPRGVRTALIYWDPETISSLG